ncbi:MAG: hypothetical protein KGY46_00655 [Anaerolineales bacterium]|nr:hypothetical protein [Anaerolineales bacterium]
MARKIPFFRDIYALAGEPGHEMCIFQQVLMEIIIKQGENLPPKAIIHLGKGQLIGEMSLVDTGNRQPGLPSRIGSRH